MMFCLSNIYTNKYKTKQCKYRICSISRVHKVTAVSNLNFINKQEVPNQAIIFTQVNSDNSGPLITRILPVGI